MKKFTRLWRVHVFANIVLIFSILGIVSIVEAANKKAENANVAVPSQGYDSANRAVQAPGNCGGMEFDRNSGSMIRKPNVDLIVKHLEIFTTDRGTWVRPTIRNICPARVSGNIHVSIGDVVVTFAGLPPRTDSRLGYAVGVPAAASYTAIVDYDNRIAESNERNNRCTRSATGSCR